ncbi:DUF922 domain-containing Zn-dependent protease [Flexivirga caeni]|uniref:DUF922 domain-containing Zn-dependent protease n=1 Tax=Flexivirga caeni TaxID=2294115 RepID=UPI001FEC6B7A|nr:DUF922 domain-containing Zn-dependent protease [Flexivirga caeni]
MTDTSNKELQAEAAKAILKRIKGLAPKADAGELRKLADAYTAVAQQEGSDFDPRTIFGREFNPFARFAERDVD